MILVRTPEKIPIRLKDPEITSKIQIHQPVIGVEDLKVEEILGVKIAGEKINVEDVSPSARKSNTKRTMSGEIGTSKLQLNALFQSLSVLDGLYFRQLFIKSLIHCCLDVE